MNQTNQRSDNWQPTLEGNTRPNHPQSARESSRRPRPHQPISPKFLQELRKCATLLLTSDFRARGPAATRHFATSEDRLSILPMSPNQSERTAALPAQPCRIRPLSVFHKGRFFRTSQIVSDRLRSSEIVWDRLGSSERTARHSRRIAEMFARFRPLNRQKERVISRQNTPRRAHETRCSSATLRSH